MNLVIDIGNTFIKIAVFDKRKIIWQDKAKPQQFLEKCSNLLTQYPDIQNLIYAASGHVEDQWLEYFKANFKVFAFNHQTPLAFNNLYETPETLGLDRLALVAAAHQLYPNQNVLIIDAGTCITYDLKSDKKEYCGGNISPGIDMRFRALHEFTARLPRLKLENPKSTPLGHSTKDAILNGVIQGVVYEIDQNIERYKSDYNDLTVILTGGDQQYLSTQLKNSIFADLTFQLIGLHAILENLLND